MARSLSHNSRVLLAFVDLLSSPLYRRGYAVASDVSVSVRGGSGGLDRIGSRSGMVARKVEENGVASEASSAWAPDPVTGYYRPINHMNEIDPVELRQMLSQTHIIIPLD